MNARIIVVTAAALLSISTAAYAMFGQGLLIARGKPPAVPIGITFSPSAPNISDTSGSGVTIATIAVTMSSGSFSGSLSLPNNGDGIAALSGSNLVTARALTTGDDGNHSPQVCASQNGVQVCQTIAVAVTSAGSIPAVAQAAGFTTPVMDLDFSQAQWANPQNLIDCSGNNSSSQYYFHQNGFLQFTSTPGMTGPCNTISQVNVGGSLVLNIPWRDTYFALCNNAGGGQCDTVGVGPNLQFTSMTADGSAGRQFSEGGFYIEATYRVDATTPGGVHGPPNGLWLSYNSAPQFFGAMEYDIGEIYTDNSGWGTAAAIDWSGAPEFPLFVDTGGTYPSGWSATTFSKQAFLVTNNGSQILVCPFINDILIHNCVNGDPNSGNILSGWKEYPVINAGGSRGDGSHAQTINYNLQYKSLRIFSCSNWPTSGSGGNCAASNLATQTVTCNGGSSCPGGTGTLQYYH
jgi:hypothetical protein